MINPYLSEGIFILTDECPFSCDYCYNRWCQKSETPMELWQIKKGIDFIMDNYNQYGNDDQPPGVFFLGGEPMIYFNELIVPAVNYVNEKYSNLKVKKTITTDAYFLTLDRVKICNELGINVNISFDGPKHVQNAHRLKKDGTGTFDKVFEHTQYAISYGILQAINSVYCPDTLPYLTDTYFFFKTIGVPLWLPHPLIGNKWTQKQKEMFAIQVDNICFDYFSTEMPDMKVGPLSLTKQKSHNTLLFYSNGDVSYNFPDYFIPPKEYPYLQRLGKIQNTPIYNSNWVNTFQNVVGDRLNDKWFGNMPQEICCTCPLEGDCITPSKTDNEMLKRICENQDPMECYQRRLFRLYEKKYTRTW